MTAQSEFIQDTPSLDEQILQCIFDASYAHNIQWRVTQYDSESSIPIRWKCNVDSYAIVVRSHSPTVISDSLGLQTPIGATEDSQLLRNLLLKEFHDSEQNYKELKQDLLILLDNIMD